MRKGRQGGRKHPTDEEGWHSDDEEEGHHEDAGATASSDEDYPETETDGWLRQLQLPTATSQPAVTARVSGWLVVLGDVWEAMGDPVLLGYAKVGL